MQQLYNYMRRLNDVELRNFITKQYFVVQFSLLNLKLLHY